MNAPWSLQEAADRVEGLIATAASRSGFVDRIQADTLVLLKYLTAKLIRMERELHRLRASDQE